MPTQGNRQWETDGAKADGRCSRSLFCALVFVGLSACTEGLRGVPMEMPRATGNPVATATTSEREGLRVLWNGGTRGTQMKWTTWVAGNPEEFEAVWNAAVGTSPPPVDFTKYVVFAAAGAGNPCDPPIIVSIDAEASGKLIFHYEREGKYKLTTCIQVGTRIARVVAVPRRIFPTTVVFLGGYAFEVPEVPFG
jgi:hypothetical protein